MPRAEAYAIGLGIIVLFQVIPVSPGSIARGIYTTSLAIHDRSFKDYNIALFLSFFKYIVIWLSDSNDISLPGTCQIYGRALGDGNGSYCASFWRKGSAVGALGILFVLQLALDDSPPYGSSRRIRSAYPVRYWHAIGCCIAGVAAFAVAYDYYLDEYLELPRLRDFWWLVVLAPLLCGTVVSLGCGGAALWRRLCPLLSQRGYRDICYRRPGDT